MIYSCFDQASGLYDYFEDGSQKPINGDLPVPQLPPAAGKIGVPALEAGRPLPSGAQPTGRGWQARGILVRCRGGGGMSSFSGFGGVSYNTKASTIVGIGALTAAGAYAGYRLSGRSPVGLVAGGAVGYFSVWLLWVGTVTALETIQKLESSK